MEPQVAEAYEAYNTRIKLQTIEEALTAIRSILSNFPELQAPTLQTTTDE